MIDVGEVFFYVNTVANKYQAGSSVGGEQFNALLAQAQNNVFCTRIGLPEQYAPSNPTPQMGWQISTKISDDLRPFITTSAISRTDDYFLYPTDYWAFSSAWVRLVYNSDTCSDAPTVDPQWLKPVTNSEFTYRRGSSVLQPKLNHPIITWHGTGFEVLPTTITQIRLDYLRTPITPVFAYTVTDGQIIYDAVNSVQCEFPPSLFLPLCSRILFLMGIIIREQELAAPARSMQTDGQ